MLASVSRIDLGETIFSIEIVHGVLISEWNKGNCFERWSYKYGCQSEQRQANAICS